MAQVKFYYEVANLFKKCIDESLHLMSAIGQGNPNHMDFAISLEDEAYITRLLKKGSKEVFKLLAAMARDIPNAYQFMEADITSSPSYDDSGYVQFYITQPTFVKKVDNVDTNVNVWDDNISEVLDGEIEDAMINYVMKEWCRTKQLPYERYQEDYQANLKAIKVSSWHRTEPPKRPYNSGF